jgi:hypothetical protein
VFGPGIAAVSLGIVGHAAFTRRIGRNESFNHAGNAFAATAAGATAYLWGPSVVFYLLAIMSAASLLGILIIPGRAIDNELARGPRTIGDEQDNPVPDGDTPSGLRVLLACRPLMIFAAAVVLFHGQRGDAARWSREARLQDRDPGTTLMSACIVAAQIVMVPMAMLVGARADRWGRKPLFLAGFLFTVAGCLSCLVRQSVLAGGRADTDGVGAGLFGALFPIIVADLMRGTAAHNVAQGAI